MPSNFYAESYQIIRERENISKRETEEYKQMVVKVKGRIPDLWGLYVIGISIPILIIIAIIKAILE